MLPLSDAPNSSKTDFVTDALIALNVVIYLLVTLPMSEQAPSPGDPRVAAYVAPSAHEAKGALDPTQLLSLGKWLAGLGHGKAALTVYQRYRDGHPQGPGLGEAHVGLGTTLLRSLDQPALAYQHFLEATPHDLSGDVAAPARAGLSAIAGMQKFPARRFSS